MHTEDTVISNSEGLLVVNVRNIETGKSGSYTVCAHGFHSETADLLCEDLGFINGIGTGISESDLPM